MIERFKTSNALLQNSLSYVGSAEHKPGVPRPRCAARARDRCAGGRASSICARDTSADALQALQERIDRFAAQAPTAGPEAEAARAMLAHARLLYDLLPAVDETLKAFIAVPSRQPLEEIRAMFSRRRSAGRGTEQRSRLLLYMVSLLLLVMLVVLGLRLRARALALRRRAAFEHVIAENSTRLINCPPAETETRLKQVLGELSRAIGVERAYVVLDEKPIRVHAWSRMQWRIPPGWPDRRWHCRAARRSGIGKRHHCGCDALPPGAVKDALTAAGVRAWACVPLIQPGRVRGIMGFDRFRA